MLRSLKTSALGHACVKVADINLAELERFIDKVMPEDIGAGMGFAEDIMNKADEEIRDFRAVKGEPDYDSDRLFTSQKCMSCYTQ